jgi:hypothetical protein
MALRKSAAKKGSVIKKPAHSPAKTKAKATHAPCSARLPPHEAEVPCNAKRGHAPGIDGFSRRNSLLHQPRWWRRPPSAQGAVLDVSVDGTLDFAQRTSLYDPAGLLGHRKEHPACQVDRRRPKPAIRSCALCSGGSVLNGRVPVGPGMRTRKTRLSPRVDSSLELQ